MTQTTEIKKLNPRFCALGATLLSAIALAVGATPASAQSVVRPLSELIAACTSPDVPECTIGDKNFWNIGFDAKGTGYDPVNIQVVAALSGGGLVYNINSNFLNPTPLTSKVQISYNVKVTDPTTFRFESILLDSTWAGPEGTNVAFGDTVTKNIFNLDTNTQVATLKSIEGSQQGTFAISGLTQIRVVEDFDSFDVNGNAQAVTNGWFSATNNITQYPVTSVPGPLPLLGAAAAFGYSRKLRTRCKTARFATKASA